MQLRSTVIPPRSHSTRLNSRRVLFIIRRICLVGSSLIHTRSSNTVQRLDNVFTCLIVLATKLSPFECLYVRCSHSESRRDSERILVENFTWNVFPNCRSNGSRPSCLFERYLSNRSREFSSNPYYSRARYFQLPERVISSLSRAKNRFPATRITRAEPGMLTAVSVTRGSFT